MTWDCESLSNLAHVYQMKRVVYLAGQSLLMILATLIAFWRVRPLAGLLLVPYLAWVSVAFALNASVWRLNRARPIAT